MSSDYEITSQFPMNKISFPLRLRMQDLHVSDSQTALQLFLERSVFLWRHKQVTETKD